MPHSMNVTCDVCRGLLGRVTKGVLDFEHGPRVTRLDPGANRAIIECTQPCGAEKTWLIRPPKR
jgi:hypothetical protein